MTMSDKMYKEMEKQCRKYLELRDKEGIWDENDLKRMEHGWHMGWSRATRYLQDLEDEQVASYWVGPAEYDPGDEPWLTAAIPGAVEPAEYGPPVDQKIVEHIKSGGTLPME